MATSKPRASDTVCQEIRSRIIGRVYEPGQRLTEEGLAAEFGISRVPIREALRLLVAEGFISMKPNWGVFVAELSAEEGAHLLEVRAVLEPLAASRAAMQRTPEQLERMRSLLKQGASAVEAGDRVRTAELNGAFHELLAHASGNTALAGLIRQLRNKINWVYAADVPTRAGDSWREHEDLVDAIEAGNAARAEAIVRLHVDRATDAYRFRTSADGERP